MKKESDSWYYAIEQVWKENGKTRAAYHGGKWNGSSPFKIKYATSSNLQFFAKS